ncbi:MAG TPA: CARDB domain-containing protein [Thermoleophilaceae bacterium]|jgi:hypothetical protein
MRRRTITAVCGAAVLAAGLVLPALALGTGAGRAAEQRLAWVKLAKCSVAEHGAVFQARMARVPGTGRMWLRFTMLERTGAEGFKPVRVPGLDRWQRSKRGVGAFSYKQQVLGLSENAVYRARVDFRWYGKDGKVMQRARRRSPLCRQFVPRPNLRAQIVSARSTRVAGVLRYGVRVSNVGQAAASDVAAQLKVDGAVVDTKSVASLAPGAQKLLGIRGPACEQNVEVTADPAGAIVESSELDNSQRLGCQAVPRL